MIFKNRLIFKMADWFSKWQIDFQNGGLILKMAVIFQKWREFWNSCLYEVFHESKFYFPRLLPLHFQINNLRFILLYLIRWFKEGNWIGEWYLMTFSNFAITTKIGLFSIAFHNIFERHYCASIFDYLSHSKRQQ